jgi:hypothetical protein
MMQCGWTETRLRIRRVGALGLSIALGFAVCSPAGAADSDPVPEPATPETAEAASSVSLDRLLTLPAAFNVDPGKKGGATRAEWNSRFAAAEAEVEGAKAELEESLGKLDELAGEASNWKVAAPGVQINPDDESPLNFGLRQEIRRRRENVERTERELRNLTIEASLAGIPEHWYRSEEAPE